ncbi:MAG: sulfatase-like hydrolase/transferase [Akkermansiaceae bacterium]
MCTPFRVLTTIVLFLSCINSPANAPSTMSPTADENQSTSTEKPNILWIVTDDHRADSIRAFNRATADRDHSALGYVSSPAADQLATQGTLFTRAYCNSPGCCPSRTSMMYGRYPHRSGHLGFENSHRDYDLSKPTVPELAKELGYTTAHFGKNGIGIFHHGPRRLEKTILHDVEVGQKETRKNRYTDWSKAKTWDKTGFTGEETFWNMPDGPVTLFYPIKGDPTAEVTVNKTRIDRELDLLYSYTRSNPNLILGGVSPQPTAKTQDGEFDAAFRQYLAHPDAHYRTPWDRKITGPPSDTPLFASLWFHFPHTPVLPSKEFRDQFKDKVYNIPDFSKESHKTLPPQLLEWFKKTNFADMTAEDKQQAIRDYFAFCAMGDSLVGQSIQAFKDYSKKQNRDWLILYVIGDHGWHLGEQGGSAKFAPYNTSNHCAVIAVSSDKKKFPAGKISHDWVEFVDFAPTILRAAGAKLSEEKYQHLDGFPLDDILTQKKQRDYVIGEMCHVIGPRAYLRSDDFAFSMRYREKNGKPGEKWGHSPGENIQWALHTDTKNVELTLFDLRSDPGETNNLAAHPDYQKLAEWFRQKLGRIILGDNRLEADWSKKETYHLSTFAAGAHDGKLDIPAEIIPIVKKSAAKKLSPEGQLKKATHDYLFDTFIEDRKTKYVGEGKDKGLKELTILQETREIRHGDELALPPGAEKIAGLFRHFAFHGANLDLIKEVHVFPFSPNSAPPRSKQVKDFYRVQMPSLPVTDKPYQHMKIRFLMKKESDTCRIDDLVFIAQKQIPPTFDDIPYRDLGSEHPREHVEILVDTTHELSIGGSSELKRDRWFRTHTTPGSTHQSFEKWALERGFYPARGFMKFNPALTRGYGKNPPQLKERPDKPGSADLSFFERYDAGFNLRQAIPEYQAIPFTSCFNDWPDFMSVPLTGRGTPLTNRFDEAAELAAAYVADQVKDGGYTATWWEVKNESSVQSEWAHHWKENQGIDGWGLLADFHNKVADAIHKSSPDTKVGGPSSAYMQVQVQDFGLFRDQARFITETKGHLDFFSHHFYENALTLGAYERRGLGYSNYLLGRYEATLDMLRAHMHKVDNVLPILITECGSLQNGREPSDHWLRLHAWNSYLTKSMQRPDQIDLFIPFVFLHMPWNPLSGDAAFTPKADIKKPWAIGDFEPTTIANFFELWRDFDGKRLPVSFDRDYLDVVAVHHENGISLAATNMGGRQLSLDLSKLAQTIGATTTEQTRLNYHKGEVVFEPRHDVAASAVPIDVNETTVIHLTTAAPLKPSGTLTLDRCYANETAVATAGKPQNFEIKIKNPKPIQHAQLIIGAHRRGGLTEALTVSINGHPTPIDSGDAHEFSEFFAPLEATIPKEHLKADNQIEITSQSGTTITSVQILTHCSQ